VSERKLYPSDLSDARWALIEPTLAAWRKARLDRRPTGQPAKVDLRDVFNALLYVNRTGILWKYLPRLVSQRDEHDGAHIEQTNQI